MQTRRECAWRDTMGFGTGSFGWIMAFSRNLDGHVNPSFPWYLVHGGYLSANLVEVESVVK